MKCIKMKIVLALSDKEQKSYRPIEEMLYLICIVKREKYIAQPIQPIIKAII